MILLKSRRVQCLNNYNGYHKAMNLFPELKKKYTKETMNAREAQRLAEFIAQYKHPGIGTATDEDAAQHLLA